MMTGIDINFRERAYRGERRALVLLFFVSVLLLSLTLYLFFEYRHLSSVLSERELAVTKLSEARDRLMAQREKLQPVAEMQGGASVDYEAFLGRYVGRAPDEVLYDLEKSVPEGVYVTGFTYDRVSGLAQVNAVAGRTELVTTVLNTLEQVTDYRQVMLTNQAEMEERGKSRFVIKIVDNNGDGVGEE